MANVLCGCPSGHQIVLVFSWFAGHMNETEAANLLEDQSPGSFLVRISSSRAHEGVFVLAVKTSNSGVVQIQIEVSRALLLEKMTICFLSQGTKAFVNGGKMLRHIVWRQPIRSHVKTNLFPRQEPVCPRLVAALSHIYTLQNLFPCSSAYWQRVLRLSGVKSCLPLLYFPVHM